MTKINKARENECKEALLKWLQPGDTIYCQLKHVSRSGMYRVINLFVIKDNQPLRISGYAADLLEGYDLKHEGCKASGCGMDMGYHLVTQLAYILYPVYECIGEGCPSCDHANYRGNREDEPRGKGVMHKDGYAFKCQWM